MAKTLKLIRVAALAVAAMATALSLNILIDVGARLHDISCPIHSAFS